MKGMYPLEVVSELESRGDARETCHFRCPSTDPLAGITLDQETQAAFHGDRAWSAKCCQCSRSVIQMTGDTGPDFHRKDSAVQVDRNG
jgi:hypothetical protein